MTFNPTEYYLWYKEYPMFNLWAVKKGVLFIPKEISEDDEFLCDSVLKYLIPKAE